MVNRKIERFEVWLVELSPTKGREINKTRPCVVISPNEMAGCPFYRTCSSYDNEKI